MQRYHGRSICRMLLVLVLGLGLLLSSCGSNDGEVFPAESSDEDYFARLLALWGNPDYTSMPVAYFPGNNGKIGWQLWATDGTEAGTRQVKIINKDGHSFPNGFIRFNHRVFFAADDGVHGQELWVTDGTEAGTKLVKDIRPGGEGSYPTQFAFSSDSGYRFTPINGSSSDLGTFINCYVTVAIGLLPSMAGCISARMMERVDTSSG